MGVIGRPTQDSAESLSTALLAYFPVAEFTANLSQPFGCSGRCGGGSNHLLQEGLTCDGRSRVLSHVFDR